MDIRCRTIELIGVLLLASVVQAQSVDWTRQCIDGVRLTGNYDRRYLGYDPPLDAKVEGKPNADAAGLFDSYGKTKLTWAGGEDVSITLDFRVPRLVSGVELILPAGRQRDWRLSVSRDGAAWHPIPAARRFAVAGMVAFGSLAANVRYLRIDAVGDEPVTLSEVVVFGEKDPDDDLIGGIYPSWYPPIAGEPCELRAVIRNTSDRAMTNLEIAFEDSVIHMDQLDAFCANVAVFPWRPEAAEPHLVTIKAGDAKASKTIPVVHRKLYLSGFQPLDFERLHHYNLYTTTAYDEYYPIHLRGRLSLSYKDGPQVIKEEKPVEYWVNHWQPILKEPWCDGIAMDEWAHLKLTAIEALKQVCANDNGKMIVPWLIPEMDAKLAEALDGCDLILSELYVNLLSNDMYRHWIAKRVRTMREHDMAKRTVIALGSFMSGIEGMTPRRLEQQIAFARFAGPEMPGIGVYGGGWAPITRIADELTYKYVIAPVVTVHQPPLGDGNVKVLNIGGMNAHDVVLVARDIEGKTAARHPIELLAAGDSAEIRMDVDVPVRVYVQANEAYTVLDTPKALEVSPDKQARGGPLQIYWDLDEKRDIARDRIEFVNADGQVVHQVANDGSWGEQSQIGWVNVTSKPLAPGRYAVRMIDGISGEVRAVPDRLDIVDHLATFRVAAINSEPWTGDPHHITVKGGDTFEVAWDFGNEEPPMPSIYLTALGEQPPIIDRKDEPFTMVRLAQLYNKLRPTHPDAMTRGRWTFPVSPAKEDLHENGGWIAYRGEGRTDMAATPGEWKLWLGGEFGMKKWLKITPPASFGAVPISPVIVVNVAPSP